MKKYIWRIQYTYYFCKRLRDFCFWKWWWVSHEAVTNDPDWIEWSPSDAVDEELSYWND